MQLQQARAAGQAVQHVLGDCHPVELYTDNLQRLHRALSRPTAGTGEVQSRLQVRLACGRSVAGHAESGQTRVIVSARGKGRLLD